MSSQVFLAIDLGAESGRGVLGSFDGARLRLDEIGRFATGAAAIIHDDGTVRWDIDGIFREVEGLVDKARAQAGTSLAGVGIDSWGVDFGLLDKGGALIAPPVCYRDRSHAEAREEILIRMTAREIWEATGIQGMPFNTLYQLAAIAKRAPHQLDAAERLLLIPDLIANRLTAGAHRSVEVTNGSTTQMMTPGAGAWNTALLDRVGLPSHFLGPIVTPSSKVGSAHGIPVYTTGTHDTASAVAAVPAAGDHLSPAVSSRKGAACNWAFLSSGTWSLLGRELESQPLPSPLLQKGSHRNSILDLAAMRAGFSNEAGVGGSTRFLKNIMGLWLVQESRKSLKRTDGRDYSYEELTAMAANSAPIMGNSGSLIDAVHNRFMNPIDMVEEIRKACAESGQPAPATTGEIVRCCLESLALAYRRALGQLAMLQGRKIEVLHVIGGGSNNAVLNQWTADACGIPVIAGPSEATAIGNILAQMIGAGLLTDWTEARRLSRTSFEAREFSPNGHATDSWEKRDEEIKFDR